MKPWTWVLVAAVAGLEVRAHQHTSEERSEHGILSRGFHQSLPSEAVLPLPTVKVVLNNHFRRASTDFATRTSKNVPLPLPLTRVPSSPPSPVPTPLDLSISKSLSPPCMVYLTSLVSSLTFLSCLPFSLLLTTSSTYASLVSQALSQGNFTSLNDLVSYTSSPQPGSEQCEAYMLGVMSALSSKSNCGVDLSNKSPVALKAKLGVGNYKVMKEAEALVNSDTGVYCYLEALASERPDDLYLWGLPGGISLPSSSKPSCSKCSGLLLNTYGAHLSNTQTLNSTVISTAVSRVNEECGRNFVTLAATTRMSAGTRTTTSNDIAISIACLVGLLWFFQ
ncbi:hypothetical protein L204_103786 [Cryptococcus depauperatus]